MAPNISLTLRCKGLQTPTAISTQPRQPEASLVAGPGEAGILGRADLPDGVSANVSASKPNKAYDQAIGGLGPMSY